MSSMAYYKLKEGKGVSRWLHMMIDWLDLSGELHL